MMKLNESVVTLTQTVEHYDVLLMLMEEKLDSERQRVIDCGIDPGADDYQYWLILQDVRDAFKEEVEKIAQARNLLKPYDQHELNDFEKRYGTGFCIQTSL